MAVSINRKIVFQAKCETLSPKYPEQKGLEEWLKWWSICLASTKALNLNASSAKIFFFCLLRIMLESSGVFRSVFNDGRTDLQQCFYTVSSFVSFRSPFSTVCFPANGKMLVSRSKQPLEQGTVGTSVIPVTQEVEARRW
jgi:hypothetical protein